MFRSSPGRQPPPLPKGRSAPSPRIICIMGMMLAMQGMVSGTTCPAAPVPVSHPFQREPAPQHLSQHPTLNQSTLQPPPQPNPSPKSTRTPNHPKPHRKPTLNQPTKPKPTPNHPTPPPNPGVVQRCQSPPPMIMGQTSTPPPPVVVVLWLGCGGLGLV